MRRCRARPTSPARPVGAERAVRRAVDISPRLRGQNAGRPEMIPFKAPTGEVREAIADNNVGILGQTHMERGAAEILNLKRSGYFGSISSARHGRRENSFATRGRQLDADEISKVAHMTLSRSIARISTNAPSTCLIATSDSPRDLRRGPLWRLHLSGQGRRR